MSDHYVAWWNVENLFDHATATRPDYLRSKLRGELVGWTAAVRDAKIAQLASVITQMNTQRGPDILGVCEIENATVMLFKNDASGWAVWGAPEPPLSWLLESLAPLSGSQQRLGP